MFCGHGAGWKFQSFGIIIKFTNRKNISLVKNNEHIHGFKKMHYHL